MNVRWELAGMKGRGQIWYNLGKVKGSGQMESGEETVVRGLHSDEVLSSLGLSVSEYWELIKSGAGAVGLSLCRSAGIFEAPLVWRALLDAAESGNVSAIRLYFDIIGRDSGAVSNSADAEVSGIRRELFGEG